MDLPERYGKARKSVFIGIFGNIFLGIIKLAAGIFGNSFAVIADSIHSISDTLTSIVVWVGLRVGKKKPDRHHPYGHGDAEPIAGLIVAIVLGIVGFEFIRESFTEIITGTVRTPEPIAFFIVIFSIFFKYWMSGYVMKIGREIDSSALISDAYHHKSDFLTSIAVLLGIFGARMGFPLLDPLAGMVVSLWIIKIGFDLGVRNIRSLMGEIPSDRILSEIKRISSGVRGVKGVHDVKVHYSGPRAFVSIHVNMDKGITLSKAHEIATEVEERLTGELDPIFSVVVHPEPS